MRHKRARGVAPGCGKAAILRNMWRTYEQMRFCIVLGLIVMSVDLDRLGVGARLSFCSCDCADAVQHWIICGKLHVSVSLFYVKVRLGCVPTQVICEPFCMHGVVGGCLHVSSTQEFARSCRLAFRQPVSDISVTLPSA